MGAACCNESKTDAPIIDSAPSAATSAGAGPASTPKAAVVV